MKQAYRWIEQQILKFKKRKYVLLCASNEMMFSYCLPVYEEFKNDKNLCIWFCFFDRFRFKDNNIKTFIQTHNLNSVLYKIAKYLPWDLILLPYHGPYFRKRSKKIYIGHGLNSAKLVDGEYKKYAYDSRTDDGKVLYEKMFVCSSTEKEMTKTEFPDHYPHIRVTGNLLLDKMLEQKDTRDQILNTIHCDPSRKTVLVASSWGPYSLAQKYNEQVLKESLKLLDEYNVIFSVHPNNFVAQTSNGFDWKGLLSAVKKTNFFALLKNESTIKFLPAADVLIMDHTSVGLFYMFLQRPVIMFDGKEAFHPGTPFAKLKKSVHVIDSIDNLSAAVEKGVETFDPARIAPICDELCSHVGESRKRYREEIEDTLKR